jgi:small subunit ribosomal protein S24e
LIHPSSVNNRKWDASARSQEGRVVAKQIIAYAEKRQNVSMVNASNAPLFLVTTTRLDPMTYVLFGAYQIAVTAHGLECDEWLPIVGNVYALDDIQRLKVMMEACMSRVFQGLSMRRTRFSLRAAAASPREEGESEDEEDARENFGDYSLSTKEVRELEHLTKSIVGILDRYAEERMEAQSRTNSRPATPIDSPSVGNVKLPLFGTRSGTSTPRGARSAYNSRPGTPSRLSRPF